MDRRHAIAEGILACKASAARYLAGFDDTNRTRQAPAMPNHVAWNLGHCALTMHRVAEKIDARPIPESDFIQSPRGDAARFGTESVSFGSKPADDPAAFPALSRCIAVYDAACDRLAASVRAATESSLDQVVPWGTVQLPLYLLVMRMAMHNGMHVGQIADLRRALGFKSIFA